MGLFKGGFLRLLQTLLYAVLFGCAAVVLGIYSYFLAVQADRSQPIPTWQKATEGLSGAAVLYTIFAVILTCCLAGVGIFSFLGLILDLLFAGAFIAIAIMTRHGASSCSGYVYTPLGNGEASTPASGYGQSFGETKGQDSNLTYAVSFRTACRMNTATFAVSIIAIFFFIITAVLQLAINRSAKKDKRFGPSPDNGYTSGKPRRNFWNRKSKKNVVVKDEYATTGTAVGTAHPTTHAGTDHLATTGTAPTHGAYYNAPTNGTAQNPYSY